MKSSPFRSLLFLMLSLFVAWGIPSGATAAEDQEPSSLQERLENASLRLKGAAEERIEKRPLMRKWNLYVYGYLEGSYTQNFNNPSNRINELRIFDVQSNQVRPNLAQFVLGK